MNRSDPSGLYDICSKFSEYAECHNEGGDGGSGAGTTTYTGTGDIGTDIGADWPSDVQWTPGPSETSEPTNSGSNQTQEPANSSRARALMRMTEYRSPVFAPSGGGTDFTPPEVTAIEHDTAFVRNVADVVIPITDSVKEIALDSTPVIGTYRAWDRGDYFSAAVGFFSDVAMASGFIGRLARAMAAADAVRGANAGGKLYVYRELSAADRAALDAGEDLVAKGTGGTISDHVAGQPTKYVSAGQTAEAVAKYSSGNGLVRIDVDAAVGAGAGYVAHRNVLQSVAGDLGRGSQAYKDAKDALEVLFKYRIPYCACSRIK